MIQGRSVVLSEIGREVESSIQPKTFCEKTGTMLSGLKDLSLIQAAKGHGLDLELLILDGSDIQRAYAEKISGVVPVRDGSTGNLYGQGYPLCGIIAKTKTTDEYLPLMLERYVESGLDIPSMIKRLLSIIGPDHGAMWVLDREFDNRKIFDLLLEEEQQFLIRLDRKQSERLLDIQTDPGKREQYRVSQLTAAMEVVGYRTVYLSGSNDPLTLIHYRYHQQREPIALITTKSPRSNQQALKIARTYLKRWKIETYFRFVKQQFNLEEMMLQEPERVDGLLSMVLIASAYVMKMEQKEQRGYIIDLYYQRWRKHNQALSSWSTMARFLHEYFQDWLLSFRTVFPTPPSHQLALFSS